MDNATANSDTLDALFELLSNRRRRYVLACLTAKSDTVLHLDDLVDCLADWERNHTDETGIDHRHRLRIVLHHCHLPQLSETPLLDYDARSQTVRYPADPPIDQWMMMSDDGCPLLDEFFDSVEEDNK